MFSVITPGGSAAPANPVNPQPAPEAPKANEGGVSLDDAVKGGEHTKMPIISGGGAAGNPGASPVSGTSVSLSGLVQGKVVVDLMDALLPALLVLLFRKMKLDVKKTQMQLTVGEKNTLAPIVEACLQSINLDFSNPWVTLAFSISIIYGGKVVEIGGVQWLDKKAGETPVKQPQTPVVPMRTANPTTNPGAGSAQPPAPNPPKPATDTAPFKDIVPPAASTQWTEDDLKRVQKYGSYGREKAIKWLQKNWERNGCRLPDKWNKPI
jgi:hypothetical protein